ncbi:hypothetical protein [Bacillus sp. UNC41MFS5]|uniref:hypothetical protein n=1 Tax=Bacillus sp. UNC41MFS5 TaxID=1449046 RepID=UPI00047B64F3|nr:hypothetical protein [Bacillus sp. UNC41MFS5]
MHRKIILIIVLLLLATSIVIVKPSLTRSFHYLITSSTNFKNENINGLQLFDNIHDKKFLNIYDEQTTKSQDNNLYNYYEIQDGVEIATNDKGDILRFIIETGIPTAKGIEIGNSIDKAKDLYGKNYYKRVEQGVDIIGYVDKKHHQSLEFWYNPQNKIIMYRLDDNSMK